MYILYTDIINNQYKKKRKFEFVPENVQNEISSCTRVVNGLSTTKYHEHRMRIGKRVIP